MVKSKSSCLKIIVCGRDSAENDDLQRTQNNGSTDKCGWSFRKRSTRHRVLSNTVISEVQSAAHKDSPEAATTDFLALNNPPIPEKITVSQWKDETMPSLSSAAVNLKVADTLIATVGASNGDYNMKESVAIVIQSAIRIYQAKKSLCKLKNVVKLQAVVRGHLVRRQAVGTLRCVQAIVKMQALVRSHCAHLSLEGLNIQEKHGRELKTDNQRVNHLEHYSAKVNKTNASIEKLLANRFARHLLESQPKTKPIHINCDRARPESAWKWLERWMSVSSSDTMQPQKSELNPEHQENGAKTNSTSSEIGTEGPAEVISESEDMKSGAKETEMLLEADDFEFQACKPTTASGKISSSMRDDLEDGCLGLSPVTSAKIVKALKETPDSFSNQVVTQSTATTQAKLSANSDKHEVIMENSKRSVKRMASEPLGTEGRKFSFGSSKSSNLAFAAVQSKFEELSSSATSGKSMSSGYRGAAVESRLDSPPSWTGSVTNAKDLSMTEELISHDTRIQMWDSECGTELSISSTLDSPDRPEDVGGETVHDIGSKGQESSDKFNLGNLEAEAINSSSMLENVTNSSYPGYVQPGKLQEVDVNSTDSVSPVGPIQHPSVQIVSDMHAQVDSETDRYVESISPEGSPRSHITVPDSHGTPSSQISQISKSKKSDNSFPSQKHQSQSVGKRSISNQSHDSAVRNSTEHLPKDPKSGKRRYSFDHEPRVSSSNSLPSYMQATESARAKAYVNHSPKSSPDVQDKDSYLKKRHSLPVTTGKQDSPRMQRSMSQAQQNVKGNAAHSPQTVTERKWIR